MMQIAEAKFSPHTLSPISRTVERSGGTNVLISFYVCSIILVGFIIATDQVHHWFIVPVFASGVLIGTDLVRWLRGQIDTFDPIGIIGLLGFHFFFLAPLLHVKWDSWMLYVVPPPDWRPWLGRMAVINLAGILVYFGSRSVFQRRFANQKSRSAWRLKPLLFGRLIGAGLVLTAALQILVYLRFGGITGYITAFESRAGHFEGMGWLFTLSESFPILAFLAFAVLSRERVTWRQWGVIFGALAAFLVLKLLFGGLRGSRSNTIWGLFWAVGIIHLWIRTVPRKLILAGLGFILVFLYVYGFYKTYGTEGIDAISVAEERARLAEDSGRTWEGLILRDLGRSDVQAYVLYGLSPENGFGYSYSYSRGTTYAGALALVIPRQIWPNRPATKVKAGTDLILGPGAYEAGLHATRIYGLAGEAMLNFGPWAAPFAFVALGAVVARVRNWIHAWRATQDCRLLLAPLLINLCFNVLAMDSDNLVFFLIKNGSIPFIVILLSSKLLQLNLLLIGGGRESESRGHV